MARVGLRDRRIREEWEAPGDEAEAERLRGTRLRHHDGGTQRTYARMVQAMDLEIGRVLQALDAAGLAHDTIVIFTSDNGGERFSDTWPFTGIKTELLEGGLRVPAPRPTSPTLTFTSTLRAVVRTGAIVIGGGPNGRLVIVNAGCGGFICWPLSFPACPPVVQ